MDVNIFRIGGPSLLAHYDTLNGIKFHTRGDDQHGGARFTTKQGIIHGSTGAKKQVTVPVDTDDVHHLIIGASGVGKAAAFLYPNPEYACAFGMSFLITDTKGDLYRSYGASARDHYGNNVPIYEHE